MITYLGFAPLRSDQTDFQNSYAILHLAVKKASNCSTFSVTLTIRPSDCNYCTGVAWPLTGVLMAGR